MTKLVTDLGLQEVRCKALGGAPLTLSVDQARKVWAPREIWNDHALRVPRGPTEIALWLSIDARAHATEKALGKTHKLPDAKGAPWYAWDAVAAGISRWMARAEGRQASGRLDDDEQLMLGKAHKLEDWGYELQNQALQGALTSASSAFSSAPMSTDRLQQAMLLLVGEQFHMREDLDVVKVDVSEIKRIVTRDPSEFISTRSACFEKGIEPDEHLPGMRIGPAGWLGNELTRQGAERGPTREWRLPNSSQERKVGTYRRCDIEAAFLRLPRE